MEMNMVAEGYHATEPVNKLNKSIGNSSPIIDNVYGILFLNKSHKKSLQKLSKKYRLFLLSNTDAIHIETFERENGVSFYSDFYQSFEKVYFS